jgi:16S rRNA (guanine(966)-N(2))-methyltransferase RsmD
MRISGGQSAGRILQVPKGFDVRPTPDLVKQSLFNSLGERVVGARILELFGGTGALSLESLSRGAIEAVCVEKAPRHAHAIRANIISVGLPRELLDVRVQDVFIALAQLVGAGKKFDIILADPPYGDKNVNRRSNSLAQRLLDDEHVATVLNAGGIFALGHTKRDTLEIPPIWHERKVLKHGDSVMRILEMRGNDGSPKSV